MRKIRDLVNDSIPISELIPDYTKIGVHDAILDRLTDFNRTYMIQSEDYIGVTNKLRWKAGHYDKIKEAAVRVAFPKFSGKPANSFKYTHFNEYLVNKVY